MRLKKISIGRKISALKVRRSVIPKLRRARVLRRKPTIKFK